MSQGDENDADHGRRASIANKAGYDAARPGRRPSRRSTRATPAATAITAGSRRTPTPRIASTRSTKQIASEKLTSKATVEARYKQNITFDAKPLSEITTVDAGAAGLASGEQEEGRQDATERTTAKKKGGIGSVTSGGKQQASDAADRLGRRARRLGNDADAKGGSNPAIVAVKLSPQKSPPSRRASS